MYERGKDAARDVEVLLQEVARLDSGEARPLTVADLNWTGLNAPSALVGPGVRRKVDLGLLNSNPVYAATPIAFTLALRPEPRDLRHRLPPGRYRIVVALMASTFDAVLYRIDLEFDGEWGESAAVWDHLSVSVARAQALQLPSAA